MGEFIKTISYLTMVNSRKAIIFQRNNTREKELQISNFRLEFDLLIHLIVPPLRFIRLLYRLTNCRWQENRGISRVENIFCSIV